MKTTVLPFVIAVFLVISGTAFAELDLEQEVLIVPDTHNEKPYIWKVNRNPKDYELVLGYDNLVAGKDNPVELIVSPPSGEKVNNMHVFIVDADLHDYAHIRPDKDVTGKYTFRFNPRLTGKYRVETVFESSKGWVSIGKDIRVKGGKSGSISDTNPGDEDYHVAVKVIPRKIYTKHVFTLLFDIKYKGEPLKGIEKVDGFDMQVATWDEDLKEFVYATPKQNLGGPEVAVSIVFMRDGKHAAFAEFRHKGISRRVDLVVEALEEPTPQEMDSPIP